MKVVRRRFEQSGFSLVELLIVIAIILIILAFAVPKLTSARMQAQETAAIKAIDTINTAQQQYYSQFGRYATSLQELGPPASGNSGPSAADLIPGDLALGTKQGYLFTMAATPGGYTVNANPVTFNSTGRRTFFTDQTLVKRENWGQEPAAATSREVGAVAAKTN
ncbi:MAG TPA: prepilin-type N-terminal cleavage/methylation domain-containing protein [Bryobacteraceae bacterium]|nr:prepilin-type N-terminal cleavage/methylation domain-containing protein [Bryobacteraceae bacterium]